MYVLGQGQDVRLTGEAGGHEVLATWEHQWGCSSNDDDAATEAGMLLAQRCIAESA
jgi:hypothetical protein